MCSIPIPNRVRIVAILAGLLLSACSSAVSPAAPATAPAPATVAASAAVTPTPGRPDWLSIPITDVRTDKTFTVNDYAGKVVLIQTMVEWCPSCNYQQVEVSKLVSSLANPDDLVPISLDVDPNEDAASLKQYADTNGFSWHFAIVPLLVARALGNLYSAEYLNGPLDPMLVIDRKGKVYGLPYGLKSAGSLETTLKPYLEE